MSNDYQMLLPDLHELSDAFSFNDFAGVPGLILWCIIVFFPLTGIDRRDTCTFYTYTLFCISAGVLLMLALPLRLIGQASIVTQFLLIIGLGLVAGLRWTVKMQEKTQKNLKPVEK